MLVEGRKKQGKTIEKSDDFSHKLQKSVIIENKEDKVSERTDFSKNDKFVDLDIPTAIDFDSYLFV